MRHLLASEWSFLLDLSKDDYQIPLMVSRRYSVKSEENWFLWPTHSSLDAKPVRRTIIHFYHLIELEQREVRCFAQGRNASPTPGIETL